MIDCSITLLQYSGARFGVVFKDSAESTHLLVRLELSSYAERIMFVGINVGEADFGVGICHRGEECETQFDTIEDGCFVVTVMVAVVIEILDEFVRFFVHVKIQLSVFIVP